MAGPDLETQIKQLQATMHTIEQVLDVGAMRAEIADLGEQVAAPDLWDDQANAQRVTGRLGRRLSLIVPPTLEAELSQMLEIASGPGRRYGIWRPGVGPRMAGGLTCPSASRRSGTCRAWWSVHRRLRATSRIARRICRTSKTARRGCVRFSNRPSTASWSSTRARESRRSTPPPNACSDTPPAR